MLLLTLLAGLALLWEAQREPLASWDNDFADFLARHSHHRAPPAPVTLVEIDDPLESVPRVERAVAFEGGLVGSDEIEKIWKERQAVKDAASNGKGNGATTAKAAVAAAK